MENFNWLELAMILLSSVVSYIGGHKVGKDVGKKEKK